MPTGVVPSESGSSGPTWVVYSPAAADATLTPSSANQWSKVFANRDVGVNVALDVALGVDADLTNGQRLDVVDNTGVANLVSITLTAGLGTTIQGLASYTFAVANLSVTFDYDKANTNWVLV